MFNEEFRNDVLDVCNYWEHRNMPEMAIEEMSELTQAIIKLRRFEWKHPEDWDTEDLFGEMMEHNQNIINEIGDVYICLMALQISLGISNEDIEKRVRTKLNKKY